MKSSSKVEFTHEIDFLSWVHERAPFSFTHFVGNGFLTDETGRTGCFMSCLVSSWHQWLQIKVRNCDSCPYQFVVYCKCEHKALTPGESFLTCGTELPTRNNKLPKRSTQLGCRHYVRFEVFTNSAISSTLLKCHLERVSCSKRHSYIHTDRRENSQFAEFAELLC